MLHLNIVQNKKSSRGQIAIQEVKDGILVLPGNEYRVLLETSSVNFELKSAEEQDVIIDCFRDFLNALPCKIQIIVRVREVDIDQYIEQIQESKNKETLPLYKAQIDTYCFFIKDMVKGNKILSRRFYIVIPYKNSEKNDFETVKEQITLTKDLILKGLDKLGMRAKHLSNLEVLDLFCRFYNSEKAKSQQLSEDTVRELFEKNYA